MTKVKMMTPISYADLRQIAADWRAIAERTGSAKPAKLAAQLEAAVDRREEKRLTYKAHVRMLGEPDVIFRK